MLGCNSSCSPVIICIFKCLDWLGQTKVLIKFINFFTLISIRAEFDQSIQFIKGLLLFYYFR